MRMSAVLPQLELKRVVNPALSLLVLCSFVQPALSQDVDNTRPRTDVGGSVTITNKGISTVPTFTLGKPAAIFDVSIRRKALSFEPQFRYGLNGKPWSFLFWGRYRLVQGDKLQLSIGAHPALNFRTTTVSVGGAQRELIVARRFLAGELYPTYALSRRVSVGAYYLYSYGVERDVARHSHFVAMRANVTNVRLAGPYFMHLAPQVYYLRVADRDGSYLNSAVTLARRDLPLSVSAVANKPMHSDIPAGKDFIWNVSLTYVLD